MSFNTRKIVCVKRLYINVHMYTYVNQQLDHFQCISQFNNDNFKMYYNPRKSLKQLPKDFLTHRRETYDGKIFNYELADIEFDKFGYRKTDNINFMLINDPVWFWRYLYLRIDPLIYGDR